MEFSKIKTKSTKKCLFAFLQYYDWRNFFIIQKSNKLNHICIKKDCDCNDKILSKKNLEAKYCDDDESPFNSNTITTGIGIVSIFFHDDNVKINKLWMNIIIIMQKIIEIMINKIYKINEKIQIVSNNICLVDFIKNMKKQM